MNIKHFFLLAVASVAFAACSQMEGPGSIITPVALKYSTVEAVEKSKAAQNLNEGTFASGESVKVRISNTGAGEWTDYDFTTGDGGAMIAPTPAPYYPAGEQNIDIVAFYPASAGTSFTVAADQTSDASYKSSDLMFASVANQAKQAAPVELAFSHRMAKLNVNITAGQGVTSITGVSLLNVKPTVSFDQAAGVVGSASGDATSIAMSNNGAAVIPPQTINGGLLSIVTDKGTATYSVEGKAFDAGHLYTLNITVNLRAVGSTTEITGWTSEGTVNVYPVEEPLTIFNATADHVGWVITSDGCVYENKAAVDAAGKTAAAMIIHVGAAGSADASGAGYRGLAVAISDIDSKNFGFDYSSSYCLPLHYATWSDAKTDMKGIQNTQVLASHTHNSDGSKLHMAAQSAVSHTPVVAGTSGWFLGSAGQWDIFLTGFCGLTWSGDSTNNGRIEKVDAKYAVTGYPSPMIDEAQYWTSTEKTDDNQTHLQWTLYFSPYESGIAAMANTKITGGKVLPFLAF